MSAQTGTLTVACAIPSLYGCLSTVIRIFRWAAAAAVVVCHAPASAARRRAESSAGVVLHEEPDATGAGAGSKMDGVGADNKAYGVLCQRGQETLRRAASSVETSNGTAGFPDDLPPCRRGAARGAEAGNCFGRRRLGIHRGSKDRTHAFAQGHQPDSEVFVHLWGTCRQAGPDPPTHRSAPPTVASASMTRPARTQRVLLSSTARA